MLVLGALPSSKAKRSLLPTPPPHTTTLIRAVAGSRSPYGDVKETRDVDCSGSCDADIFHDSWELTDMVPFMPRVSEEQCLIFARYKYKYVYIYMYTYIYIHIYIYIHT